MVGTVAGYRDARGVVGDVDLWTVAGAGWRIGGPVPVGNVAGDDVTVARIACPDDPAGPIVIDGVTGDGDVAIEIGRALPKVVRGDDR